MPLYVWIFNLSFNIKGFHVIFQKKQPCNRAVFNMNDCFLKFHVISIETAVNQGLCPARVKLGYLRYCSADNPLSDLCL